MSVNLLTGRYNDFPPNGTPAIGEWKKVLDKDRTRLGLLIQNQDAAAFFWVCNRQPNRNTQAVRFSPNQALAMDWIAPQDEIWLMSDTAGVYLTLTEFFSVETNV